MDKYSVRLDPEERIDLQRLVATGKAAARRLVHARILLLADQEDCSDEEIVSAVGIGLRTVERVRKRLVTEGLEAAIDHKPQPPRPEKIKIRGDVEQKLVELACSEPPRDGAIGPCDCWPTRWSCLVWWIVSALRPCGRR